ncbi:MAG: phosphatidate cytidylyltransferase [Clostridiales bacterium]|nr:phosphatidate cytidylyltransferase [Clostridiales bacterium]
MLKKIIKNGDFLRVVTSLAGLPILWLFLYLGNWPLKAALFALAATGMYEFYKALSGKHKTVHFLGYIFAGLHYALLDYQAQNNANVFTIIIMSFTLAVCVAVVIFHSKINVWDAAVTYFGFCYVAVLLSTVYLTNERYGYLLVAVAFISAWGCDTGAYVVGRTLGRSGKHKLIPSLSPKKTVEGAIGGTVTAGLLTGVLGLIVSRTNTDGGGILLFVLLGMICAVFAQLGDLFASAVKRHTGIKDFGSILPGHGGILDRFDSVFFTAPMLYVLALIIIK